MVLRRVGVLSMAKINGIISAAMGLIIGLFMFLLSMIGGLFPSGMSSGSEGAFGFLFGGGAIILAPLFYGIFGFIAGLIGAFIYNFTAGFVGGIELDLE